MKYFLDEAQRKAIGSTSFFEFQRGEFRNKFWLKDSLFLHADTFDSLMLYELFSDSVEGFCYYATTEVSKEQWDILATNSEGNEQWKDIIEELRPWVEECLAKHKCFNICGI